MSEDVKKYFYWSDPLERDLVPPKSWDVMVTGWDFNAYTGDVFQAWTTAGLDGTGSSRKGSASAGKRFLFSTAEKAREALRHEVCVIAAKKLRDVEKKKRF